jgi:all-trans-retinol 13,14-reductase
LTLENTPGAFSIYAMMRENSFKALTAPEFHFESGRTTHSVLMHTPKSGVERGFSRTVKIMTMMNLDEVPGWDNTAPFVRNKKYEAFKRKKAESILDQINKTHLDLKEKIECYYTSTPLTIRDYSGSYKGSAYGIVHDYHNILSTMIPYKTKFGNLFLSGQNINFHGLLGVSITTLITCSTILNENFKGENTY